MSLADTYRNNIKRKSNEKTKLLENKGKESEKLVVQNKKIMSRKTAILKTNSQSIIKSKQNEIERAEKEISNIYKRIADIDKKITQKEKEITIERERLEKEEQRMAKKQLESEAKRLKENDRKMKELLNKPTNQYINNGGEMNIANDNAIINVTHNYYNDISKIQELVEKIKSSDLSNFNDEEKDILIDNVDILQEQLLSDEPKKGFVRTAIAGITTLIDKSTELTEPLQKLIEFAQSILN